MLWKRNLCLYFQNVLDFTGLYNISIRNVQATNDGIRFTLKIFDEEIDVNLTGEKEHFEALRHPCVEKKALIAQFQALNSCKEHIQKCWRHLANLTAEYALCNPMSLETYFKGVRGHLAKDTFIKLLQLFLSMGVDPNTIENRTLHLPVVDGVVLIASNRRKNDALELVTIFGGNLLEKCTLHSHTRLEMLLQNYSYNCQGKPFFLMSVFKSEEFKSCSTVNLISLGNFLLRQISDVLHLWSYDDYFLGANMAVFQAIEWLKIYTENLAENKISQIKSQLVLEYCGDPHGGRTFTQMYEIVANFLGINIKRKPVYCNCNYVSGKKRQPPKPVQCLKNHCIAPLKQYFMQQEQNKFNFESIKSFTYFPECLKQEIIFPQLNFFGNDLSQEQFTTVKDMLRMWYENDHM